MTEKKPHNLNVSFTGRVKRHLLAKRDRAFRKVYHLRKVRQNRVVFESYLGRSYACSPRALYESMLHDPQYAKFTFIWTFEDPKKYKHLSNSRTRIVKYRSFAYFMAFATSKYWIVNGWLPLKVQKKHGQIMLQCWHGTPLKRLRNDIIPNTKHATLSYDQAVVSNRKDTVRYDYLISPSRFASEVFTSAFGLKDLNKEDIVIETGYPRNDFLYKYTQVDVYRIKTKLKIPTNKKVLLYAPTWRDDQHAKGEGFTYDIGLDFTRLRQRLSDEYIVLFRAHYNIASTFNFDEYEGFIYDVSAYDEISELYVISDVLMTDYSSVFFDYANLRRPIIFYMYDYEYYKNDLRGFYLDIDELPGPIVKNEDDLYGVFDSLDGQQAKYEVKYATFNKKFNYLDDAHASERTLEEVIK